MDQFFSGWLVERAIPWDVWKGLQSGEYKLYGGVIRGAVGTARAGQIIRHLIPTSTFLPDSIPQLINMYQLQQVSSKVSDLAVATQQVLSLATGTAVMAGLNLAVSAIGFVFLSRKLTHLEEQLTIVQKEVREIRALLERRERAELRAALRDLLKLDEATHSDHRHTILHNARRTLAQLHECYRELFGNAETVETALAYEEYFCVTALAQIRCTAELGMLEIARRELEEIVGCWKSAMKHSADTLLLQEHPERFLCSDFVDEAPVGVLAEWLDVVRGEEKGYRWLDELRSKGRPWYPQTWIQPPVLTFGASGLQRDKEVIIPALQKFVARNNVFEGHVAQYELFEKHKLRPSDFERGISAVVSDAGTNGYVILSPVSAP